MAKKSIPDGAARKGGDDSYKALFKTLANLRRPLRDPKRMQSDSSVTFSSYDKDDILGWLRSPSSNEQTLRKSSMQLYNNSIHYRKLILHYALMSNFYYTMSPVDYVTATRRTRNGYDKAYAAAASYLGEFAWKQELTNASICAYRDGVYYGAIWRGRGISFIQRIDPDICKLSAMEDGRWTYSVDVSRIQERDLYKYPPEFTKMHNAYKASGVKDQDVPSDICFCLKGDETVQYPFPPFASLMPSVYDLENMKDLATVSTELENYKLINYIYETKDDGSPAQSAEFNSAIYQQIASALPEQVGLAMTGTKLESVDFDRSGHGSDSDKVEQAINSFWVNAGLPGALWGSPDVTGASAILLSLKSDEAICFAMLRQIERVMNALLRLLPGTQKFKVTMLPITCYGYDKAVDSVRQAATLGLPVKQDYCALMNMCPEDIAGRCYVENSILNLTDVFVPLKSTYNESSIDNDGGAPVKEAGDISEEGERARDKPSADDP